MKFWVFFVCWFLFVCPRVGFTDQQLKSVRIRGMVCSFCAQGLVAGAKAHPKVSVVDVSLEKKTMSLLIKEGQTMSDEEVQQLVQDSGFKVESVQ
ncbi:MAG: hypothetical protein K2X47_10735 [Bdellovibrionales bacterium]|nr:hypothetical protein [Bdellovibrionales bacterium]